MRYKFWILLIIILFIRFKTSQPNFVNGQRLKISGEVISEPTYSAKSMIINLIGFKIRSYNLSTNIHYGDIITVEGTWKDGFLVDPQIDEINSSVNIFVKIRKHLVNFYNKSFGKADGKIISAIVLGAKENLPYYFTSKAKLLGVNYLFEASAVKVSILAGFLVNLFVTKLKRPKTAILVIGFILFYTLISGFQLTTIKGSILVISSFIALIFGKVKNSLRIIFLTAFLMLFFFPFWKDDLGFLLSFSASLSIIIFRDVLTKILKFIPEVLRQDLSISLAAQIGIAPITFLVFNTFNLIAPIINILIAWTIVPIMVIGGVSGILSFIFPELAKIVLELALPLTAWIKTIISLSVV